MAIQRPSDNYNSDWMSRMQDGELEELEKRLSALYASAAQEVTDKFNEFTEEFAEQEARMLDLLALGKIDDDDFRIWRNNHILQSVRYQELIKSLTNMMVDTDVSAMAIVSGDLPWVIAQSYNFMQALGWDAANQAGYSAGTFTIYNASAVQALIRDNPDLLPSVKKPIDEAWNMSKITREITQGIIQGNTMPQIADRLRRVVGMDENTAMRNARTSFTYAENLGRDESFENLKSKGIPVKKRWNAVMDNRTRQTHRLLNGTFADEETGLFGVGILAHPLKCPADKTGDAEEIYNCRCREGVVFPDDIIDHSNDDELYEQFLRENYPNDYEALLDRDYFNQHTSKPLPRPEVAVPAGASDLPSIDELEDVGDLSSGHTGIVKGSDLADTWRRRPDEFEYAIDDIIDAQGYNGLPRVVDEEEFNKAVQESKFIAQRTYGTSSQEQVDMYRDELYNGNFYVNCETGGAQYGQGMYCAADYNGELTDGIKAEMSHYQELAAERFGGERPEAEQMADVMKLINQRFDDVPEGTEQYMRALRFGHSDADYEIMDAFEDRIGGYDEAYKFGKLWSEVPEFGEVSIHTETLTLAPEAKIITGHRSDDIINNLADEYALRRVQTDAQRELLQEYISLDRQMQSYITSNNLTKAEADAIYDRIDQIRGSAEWASIRDLRNDFYMIVAKNGDDAGVAAAMMGYDAINATGHGDSGSYTVILNRTMIIFKKGEP